jgi:hypothetical protein
MLHFNNKTNSIDNPKRSSIFLLPILFLLITGCKKDPIAVPPPGNNPQNNIEKGSFSFSSSLDLSGQPYHTSNLRAVVSIINDKNVEVIKDSVVQITINGFVKTGALELPLGNYKLTSFRLEYGSVNTHFAAPIIGSTKASMVQNPLSLDFKVEKGIIKDIQVEVLKVQTGDKPQAFGYSSGAFDYGQEDANPVLKIKMQAIMQVGEVLYDSIPASLTLTTWLSDGERRTSYISLSPGINEISLLKAAVKYDFLVSKWGTKDAISVNRQDIDQVSVYTLGGSKAAKKLKSEIVAKSVNGTYVAESKTNYIYNSTGNIYLIEYLFKKADNTINLSMTDRFEYSGSRVQKITRYDEQNQKILYKTSFAYDNQGRVLDMIKEENNIKITANVDYFFYGKPEIKISYDYPESLDMDYYTTYYRGNILTSSASRTNGDTEQGNYEYDFNISPYKHMNWPDFFLSHHSKNNMTVKRMQYYGSYPQNEPYLFNYTYDADGYPTSVIKNYKSYITGIPAFSTKTIYAY